MAARYRTATGNWSNPAQWNGGTLPGVGDDCYCNGFTVTLDQDVTAVSVRNDSLGAPVIAAGGSVSMASLPIGGRFITANVVCNSTTSLLQLTATANGLTITGNGTRGNTGNGGNALVLNNCAGTTVNLIGNWQSGTGGVNSSAIGVTGTCGTVVHTGVLTGTTAAMCAVITATGARSLSFGTVAASGLSVGGGTGAGHTVTVANLNNTIVGFSTSQVCLSLTGIIASATINTTGDIATGTCRACDLNQSAGSGLVTLTVNGGSGDIRWPNGGVSMIGTAAGAGVTTTITCRDIYGHRVGSPNTIGVITQNAAAANVLTVYARDIMPGTVSGASAVVAAVVNLSASATVNLHLSGANGAVGGSTAAIANMRGAVNNSTGSFNLYGIARGGTSTGGGCEGFVNISTGAAFVTTAISNNAPNGMAAGQFGTAQTAIGGFITVDNMEDGSGGWPATGGRHFIRAAGVNSVKMRETNAGVIMTLGEVPADYPAVADVRSGTAYDFGAQTGTLAVPPVGSVALGVPTDNTTGTAALTGGSIADAVLARNLAGGSDGGRTVRDALRASRNKSDLSGGTLTVYEEDDSTPAWTAAVTTAARDPVSSIDPA